MISKNIIRKIFKKTESTFAGKGLDRNPLVNASYKFLRSYLKSDSVVIDGNKMYLDPDDSLRLSINKIYEEYETKLVKKIVKKDDVVIDLGANIGYYTLIFAKLVGDKGKVYAFEPDPENFALLKKNIETNCYQNVVLIPKAVSSKNGKQKLYLSNENKGSSSFIHRSTNKKNQKFVEVESIRLDDYFAQKPEQINFIKMDIEGHEEEALKGMTSLLQRSERIGIMMEFFPYLIKTHGIDPKAYISLFNNKQWKIYELNRRREKATPFNFDKLLEDSMIRNKVHPNMLCLKGIQLDD